MKLFDRMLGKALERAAEATPVPGKPPLAQTPGFGPEAAEQLRGKTALVVGVGAIGGAAAPYLVAAGVPQVLLCDFGGVQYGDLSHEVLYGDREIRRRKVEAATERLQTLNRRTQIHALAARADREFLERRISDIAIVLDASNDAATRATVHDVCLTHRTPWVTAMAAGTVGRVVAVRPDLDESPGALSLAPPVDADAFAPPVAGIVGSAMAMLALQVMTGQSSAPIAQEIDIATWSWRIESPGGNG